MIAVYVEVLLLGLSLVGMQRGMLLHDRRTEYVPYHPKAAKY